MCAKFSLEIFFIIIMFIYIYRCDRKPNRILIGLFGWYLSLPIVHSTTNHSPIFFLSFKSCSPISLCNYFNNNNDSKFQINNIIYIYMCVCIYQVYYCHSTASQLCFISPKWFPCLESLLNYHIFSPYKKQPLKILNPNFAIWCSRFYN